jgi:D-arabinose 1-dehydrogenase-like Zn-dependent alcohol dehydrogenase
MPNIQQGQYMVVLGTGDGLGHFAVQYGIALGAKVIAVDSGSEKKALVESYGVEAFADFTKTTDIVSDVLANRGVGRACGCSNIWQCPSICASS